MRISLIICTRNRAARLPEFFDHLGQLAPPPGGAEVILVDNGSSDETPDVLQGFVTRAPFPVHCVRAPVRGLARARNAGLAQACGAILAFTDDDCYVCPEYLEAVVQVFEEAGGGFLGGRVVLHDPTDAPIGIMDVEIAAEIGVRSFVPAGVIHGANMAVARDVVRSIGGFDPLLGAGTACMAGEDTEYVARAAWAGWTGRYDPRPVVAHHHRRKPGPEAERQIKGYDYGRGAYYAKFVLDPRSRSVYLRRWYWRARAEWSAARRGRLRRELAGAVRYLIRRLYQPQPVPLFPKA
jgi:glycosyltransferase involved in cell wall biosynthesis